MLNQILILSMKKLKLYLFVLGLFIQLYYLFSWIYPLNLNLPYKEKQNKYMEFWPMFSDPYHSVFFVFVITLFIVFAMVYTLAVSKETLLKKVFLIIECLFLALVGFSLL